jgi:hypothetical protein
MPKKIIINPLGIIKLIKIYKTNVCSIFIESRLTIGIQNLESLISFFVHNIRKLTNYYSLYFREYAN